MPVAQAPWQVRAEARYVRRSPRKVKLVVDEIRGLSVPVARTVLAFMTQAGAKDVKKVLSSAAANAEANYGLISDELVVAEAHVGQGPTLRRYRPRARGRVGRIRKPTCHIFIGLSEPPELWDESSELVPILPPDADVMEAAVEDVGEVAPGVEADQAGDDAGEPYEGYTGSTAKEVIARLPELDDAALARVAAADTRKTVQAQIGVQRRRRGLDEPAQTDDGAGTADQTDQTAAEPPADQEARAGSPAERSGGPAETAEATDGGEPEAASERHTTQPVSKSDLENGRIRVPRGRAKELFPPSRCQVEVELRGEVFECRWDPRYGPDQERSGVLGIGKARLARLVERDEVLRISRDGQLIRLTDGSGEALEVADGEVPEATDDGEPEATTAAEPSDAGAAEKAGGSDDEEKGR